MKTTNIDFNELKICYFLKNIPIPNKHKYMIIMLNKIESFLYRMRWKAFFALNSNARNSSENNILLLKMDKYPPVGKETSDFEKDLIGI